MAKRKRPKSSPTPGISADFFLEKERMMAAVSKALQNAKSPEEAQALLNEFVGMRMEDVTRSLRGAQPKTASEKADDRYFEAMNAPSLIAARRKLAEALKIDPDHVSSLTAMAMMQSSPEDTEKGIRQAIAAGERRLGALLANGRGHLWGFHEARPYMEARAQLAEFLAAHERKGEAIEEQQALLALNEDDNQGMRYPLMGLLLETRRFQEARELLKKYNDDYSAAWHYARALLAFYHGIELAGWDTGSHDQAWIERNLIAFGKGTAPYFPKQVRAADASLLKALKFNPWCALYLLTASDHLDDEPPDSYSPGSEEEALIFLEDQTVAWLGNPTAMLWMMTVAMPWLAKNGFANELDRSLG